MWWSCQNGLCNKMKQNNLINTYSYYFVLGILLIGIGISTFFGVHPDWARSAGFGLLTAGLSFFFIELTSRGLLIKKSVAFTGLAIVFKYAILGMILYFVVTSSAVHKGAFLVGFSSFIPGAIVWIWSLRNAQDESRN